MKQKVLSLGGYGAALIIPFLIVLAVLYTSSIYPFGEGVLAVWDLQITYTYFFEWFRSVLEGDANLFYSFSKSLGGGMYAGWASILVSPVNWFIVLFPDNPIDFITFMILVKFGLAGLTSYFYIRRRFTLSRPLTLCLSICYAMMLFMTTQSANPMWMDAVVMLPLVMYGLYLVVREGKVVLFFVSLLLTILFNYYNGYMICLFSIMFYLYESYLYAPKAPHVRARFMVNPGRFSGAFTLAVLASVFVLLPTVIGLMAGKGAVPDGLFDFEFRYQLNDVVRSLFLGVYEKEYLPQLYCGTFALIGMVWFFLNQKIGKREKIAAAAFIGFLVICTWYAPFDRIWLGFRDGNSFYCRFTFLIAALIIFVAARSLEMLDKSTYKRLAIAAGIIALISFIILADGGHGGRRYFLATVAMCIAIPVCLVLINKYKTKDFIRIGASLVLIAAVSTEAYMSCDQAFAFRYKNNKTTYSYYENYYKEGRAALSKIDENDNSEANAYRIEKTFNLLSPYRVIALNETMAFRYLGIALYDSTYDDRVQNLLHRLGYTPDRNIRTSYNDPMIVADSLLGIRYVADDALPYEYKETGLDKTWEGRSFYENPHALPLGYGASTDILETLEFNGNPFDYQNDLVNALAGEESDCLVAVKTQLISKEGEEWVWEVEAPDDVSLYGYIEYPESPQRTAAFATADNALAESQPEELSVDLYDGDEHLYVYIDNWSQGVFPITSESDDGVRTISLKGEALKDFNGEMTFYAAYVDQDSFESVFNKLASKPFNVETFEDGYVAGTYESDGRDILFTTIPYDSGWTIKINGEVVEPKMIQDCFIGLEVSEGNNVIEMTYSASGFAAGVVVSVGALALFMIFAVILHRRPLKAKPDDI